MIWTQGYVQIVVSGPSITPLHLGRSRKMLQVPEQQWSWYLLHPVRKVAAFLCCRFLPLQSCTPRGQWVGAGTVPKFWSSSPAHVTLWSLLGSSLCCGLRDDGVLEIQPMASCQIGFCNSTITALWIMPPKSKPKSPWWGLQWPWRSSWE